MNTFFTSDTHFGHANIIKYCNRPYNSAEEMDAALIKNWNSKVTNNDKVYHLGDFCFSNRDVQDLLKKLNFKRFYFVIGNHDKPWKKWKSSHKRAAYAMKVSQIDSLAEINIYGQHIVLCHYPLASWNRMRYNSWMLCGHTHGNYDLSRPGTVSGGKILDVGVDCHNYEPISFDEIGCIMKEKELILI